MLQKWYSTVSLCFWFAQLTLRPALNGPAHPVGGAVECHTAPESSELPASTLDIRDSVIVEQTCFTHLYEGRFLRIIDTLVYYSGHLIGHTLVNYSGHLFIGHLSIKDQFPCEYIIQDTSLYNALHLHICMHMHTHTVHHRICMHTRVQAYIPG